MRHFGCCQKIIKPKPQLGYRLLCVDLSVTCLRVMKERKENQGRIEIKKKGKVKEMMEEKCKINKKKNFLKGKKC